jgi:hypothetical protein
VGRSGTGRRAVRSKSFGSAGLTGRGGFSPPRKGERRNQDGRDNGPRERYQPPPNVKFDSHTNRYDAPMPDRRESFGRDDHGRGERSYPRYRPAKLMSRCL